MPLPVRTANMRPWDRPKPSTSWSSPETLAKIASVPDRPWCKIGKIGRLNATITTDISSPNLQLTRIGGDTWNRYAMSQIVLKVASNLSFLIMIANSLNTVGLIAMVSLSTLAD